MSFVVGVFVEYFVLKRRCSKGFFVVVIFMSFVEYVSVYDKYL